MYISCYINLNLPPFVLQTTSQNCSNLIGLKRMTNLFSTNVGSNIENVQVVVESDPRLSSEENQSHAVYIHQCNRGGLIFPSEFIFTACSLAWSLLQEIKERSELIKLLFQENISSQMVFCLMFLKFVESCETTKETLTEFQCENGHSQRETLKSLSKKLFNIFSKNFVSMSNSAIHSKKVTVETNHKRHHNTLKIKKLQSNQI